MPTVVLLLCGVVILVGGLAELRDIVRAPSPGPFDRRPDVDDLTVLVLMLGFAGERAFYLLRRRSSGDGQVLRGEVLSLAFGAVGLVVGLTL